MHLNHVSSTTLFRLFVEEGNSEAISLFFQNQSDLFYRVAFKYTKNSADAEDVLQAAFIRISTKAHQYKGLHTDEEKLLQSWCLSIVVNCALKKNQAESNRKKKESHYLTSKLFHEEKNMAANLDNEVVFQKVQKAIIQLPEKFRIPIHLKYIEGFELDAIANILKLNANTLRTNIKRGLEKISEDLKNDNVTLSSVSLIGVIESLPLEQAPLSIKNFATKNFNAASSSRRLMTNGSGKTFLKTFALYGSIIGALTVIAAGAIYWNKWSIINNNPVSNITKIENLTKVETNQTWSFKNEKDRNLTKLMGTWKWENEYESMTTPYNKILMISLPIPKQEKLFVVECELRPFVTKEFPETVNLFRSYWIKNNAILGHEEFVIHDRTRFLGNGIIIERIYFYQNYVCVFRDNKLFQLNRYLVDLKEANVLITSNNYMYQKITSRTLNAPPDELLNAIKMSSSLTKNIQENWPINESGSIIKE